MKRRAFTLLELLIVVAIIAVLIGMALPYYQNYVRETKITKARRELDVLMEALVKYDTFEDKKFSGTDLSVLLGKYLQTLPTDPWGRPYEVNADKGQIKCLGPDHVDLKDDIIVDYKPPLVLQKAIWVDMDNNLNVSPNDLLKLEFSKFLKPNMGALQYGIDPNSTAFDLLFSPDVKVANLVATSTQASSTIVTISLGLGAGPETFWVGSSTIRVASGNDVLMDCSDRKANGTTGGYPGYEVIIKGN